MFSNLAKSLLLFWSINLVSAQDAIRTNNLLNFHKNLSSLCNGDQECITSQVSLISKCPSKSIKCETSVIEIEKNILDECKNDLQCVKAKTAKVIECTDNESCSKNYKNGSFKNLGEVITNSPSQESKIVPKDQVSVNRYHSLVYSNCLFSNECVTNKFSLMAKCNQDTEGKCSATIYKSELKIKRECSDTDSPSCYKTKNEELANCLQQNNCKSETNTGMSNIRQIAPTETKSPSPIQTVNNPKASTQEITPATSPILAEIKKYLDKMTVSDQVGISKHLIDGQERLKKLNEKYAEDVNEINNKWK